MAIPNPAWRQDTESLSHGSASDRPQALQRLFLTRLRRLTWLRRSCSDQMDGNTLRVLDKSIYSTYCDCVEVGANDEAREMLKQAA